MNINLVPEWSDHYIAYSQLKKTIYQLEKELPRLPEHGRDIEAPLLSTNEDTDEESPAVRVFAPMLEKEVERISTFYKEKETELDSERQRLFDFIKRIEFDVVRHSDEFRHSKSTHSQFDEDDHEDNEDPHDHSDSDEDEDEITKQTRQDIELPNPSTSSIHLDPQQYNDQTRHETDLREAHYNAPFSPGHARAKTAAQFTTRRSFNGNEDNNGETDIPRRKSIGVIRRPSLGLLGFKGGNSQDSYHDDEEESIWISRSNYAIDQRIIIKKRLTELFVQFSELKQFSEINETGFKKILKK